MVPAPSVVSPPPPLPVAMMAAGIQRTTQTPHPRGVYGPVVARGMEGLLLRRPRLGGVVEGPGRHARHLRRRRGR